jgi:molybdopterin converting factor small subunit
VIRLELPKALCSYADERSSLVLEGPCGTVGEALTELRRSAPAALDRIMDEQGTVRRHVNVFLNGENIRFLDGLSTPARDGATILVIAAVSGG